MGKKTNGRWQGFTEVLCAAPWATRWFCLCGADMRFPRTWVCRSNVLEDLQWQVSNCLFLDEGLLFFSLCFKLYRLWTAVLLSLPHISAPSEEQEEIRWTKGKASINYFKVEMLTMWILSIENKGVVILINLLIIFICKFYIRKCYNFDRVFEYV